MEEILHGYFSLKQIHINVYFLMLTQICRYWNKYPQFALQKLPVCQHKFINWKLFPGISGQTAVLDLCLEYAKACGIIIQIISRDWGPIFEVRD